MKHIFNIFIIIVSITTALKFFQKWQFENSNLGKKIPLSIIPMQHFLIPRSEIIPTSSFSIPHKTDSIFIFVWATWCAPCKVELYRIQKILEDNPRLLDSMVLIASDSNGSLDNNIKAIQDFFYGHPKLGILKKQVIIGEGLPILEHLSINSTPTSVIVNHTGQVLWYSVGISPSLSSKLIAVIGKKSE